VGGGCGGCGGGGGWWGGGVGGGLGGVGGWGGCGGGKANTKTNTHEMDQHPVHLPPFRSDPGFLLNGPSPVRRFPEAFSKGKCSSGPPRHFQIEPDRTVIFAANHNSADPRPRVFPVYAAPFSSGGLFLVCPRPFGPMHPPRTCDGVVGHPPPFSPTCYDAPSSTVFRPGPCQSLTTVPPVFFTNQSASSIVPLA